LFKYSIIIISFFLIFKAKGLPPLPDPSAATALGDHARDSKPGEARKQDGTGKEKKKGLSFSSSPSSSGPVLSSKSRPMTAKRKVVGGEGEGEDDGGGGTASASKSKKVKKKPKVGLSFADDA